MADLSQTDIDVYLQLAGCAYSDLSKKYSDDLKYGRKCAVKNKRNLILLNIYIEILECYQPLSEEVVESDNCVTEEEIQLIIEKISVLSDVCFMPIGFTYTPNT